MATGIKQQDRQDTIAGWLFMSPTLVVLGIFMLLPMLFALYFSFTDWNGISPPADANWIGLANFQELLLQDGIRRADFFKALKNTAYFSLGVVPLQTSIALFLAVVVNQRRLRFKDFFRTSYYLPAITSSIAIVASVVASSTLVAGPPGSRSRAIVGSASRRADTDV